MRTLIHSGLAYLCVTSVLLTGVGCSSSGKDDAKRDAEFEALRTEVVELKAQLAALPGGGAGQQPDKKSANAGSLTVVSRLGHQLGDPPVVLAELYHEGKMIRSRELNSPGTSISPTDHTVTWERLAPGRYEVHFQAPGYEKFVKRLLIAEEDRDIRVGVEVSKKAVVVGGDGPSLQEVGEELGRHKKENADLRAKVESLQAEVSRLKKQEAP